MLNKNRLVFLLTVSLLSIGAAVSKNEIYVTNIFSGKIHVFDKNSGKLLNKFGERGTGKGKLSLPWDVAIGKNRRIYVSDLGQHKVLIFDFDGKFISQFGEKGEGKGEFIMPFAVELDRKDNVYVVDTWNNRVQVFDPDGEFMFAFGSKGSRNGEFLNPKDIALSNRRVYVADAGNNRIQVFDEAGRFISRFGRPGSQIGDFSEPVGIAASGRGLIYVCDENNNRVQVFDQSGRFLFKFGKIGNKICVDSNENIYVVDNKNNNVQIFSTRSHPDQMNKQCLDCHADIKNQFQMTNLHPNKDKDFCAVCHTVGTGIGVNGVSIPGSTACFGCHLQKMIDKSYLHGPLRNEDCVMCHLPHSSDHKNLLIKRNEELCEVCHEKFIESQKKEIHGQVIGERCLSCHEPHNSDYKYQLREGKGDLCILCHANKKDIFGKKYVHQPVEKDGCPGCHQFHNSQYSFLLKASFPESNYVVYSKDAYGLCLQCHNPKLAENESIVRAGRKSDTNFRNGGKNLHYKHVNSRRGRNCSACHDPHSSDQQFLIRKSQFVKTQNGGKCSGACHGERSYKY